jgi:hypothetical protein
MVAHFGAAWRQIQARLGALTTLIEQERQAGNEVTPGWLFKQRRLEALRAEVEAEIRRFVDQADEAIRQEQGAAVEAAQRHSESLVATAQGSESARVGTTFQRLPRGAVEDLVGFLADGSPLRELLDELPNAAGAAVRSALIAGVATGQGARQIARRIRGELGGNLTRALTISRTEVLRAYRGE